MAATVPQGPRKTDQSVGQKNIGQKSIWQTSIWRTLGAIKTGVILLILVVILSAAGTVILQRPTTDAEEMQRAYSPQVLHVLDAVGLTDVFHAWWFVALLALVSVSIISASVQRFPNAWRFYSRPYKSPDEAFRKALPSHALIPLEPADEEAALSIADQVFHKAGLRPERIVRENGFSVFGERNRFSEMAVYVVHASLLLIFLGGIIDALYGWRAFVTLSPGQQASQVEPQKGVKRTLPFAVLCEGAGQENYADGTPKRWWSDLAVVKHGEIILRKQIVVNDPLVYDGIRFYQASYGKTGKLDKLVLTAAPRNGGPSKEVIISPNETVALDDQTTVRLAEFIPDYVVGDGQIYSRSNELQNPAAHLIVESKNTGNGNSSQDKSAQSINVWLPKIPGYEQNASSPYAFEGKDIQMAYFTGLEVSHEPGQWGVWAGVVLMGIGLAFVFYFVHTRVWAVPVQDANGRLMLWIGGASNKNKDIFEQKFRDLTEQITEELKLSAKTKNGADAPVSALAGK